MSELGCFIRLLRYSWRQATPCSLPDDPDALAALVGVNPGQWERLTRLPLLWTRCDDGRLHFVEARNVFDRMQAHGQRRASIGTAAAQARWSATPAKDDASRMRDACMTHAPCMPSVSPAPSEDPMRSAPLRPLSITNSSLRSSWGAQSAEVIGQIGGAGARALAEGKLTEWRRAQSLRMLRAFVEELRATGKSTAPLQKADELSAGPHSTPDRVDAAICRVRDRLAVKDCSQPLGFLIAMLGLSAKGTATLIEVPLVLASKWDSEEALVAKRLAVSVATAAALEVRRNQLRGAAAAIGVSA